MHDQNVDPAPPRRRGLVVLLGVAGAALAVAVGLSIGLAMPVLTAPSDDSSDVGFARDMSTHHAQAVEMSMLGVRQAGLEEVRRMALDMGLTQQAQIGTMRAWLKQWNVPPTGTGPRMAWMRDGGMSHDADMADQPAEDAPMPGMATEAEMARLGTLSGAQFDALFCDLMIRHHAGGIEMVDAVLRTDPEDEVRELAEAIKVGQQSEINALTQLKSRLSEQ
ncbi:DUF305 domain-containing protein [Spirilliplanes yamanashiensis]|uniref:DUF305 domain-containing protein n=1 Tax=Spirilliplanes yamanashiensis TaxID=42233 RepID=A0A8J3YF68_9ACTN|nr:DUF305 domain-containing protein [Spirilliplanes yamanashiensis]MDP9818374.1 uncharacterized protein (DUF305 family) [Spirilliplanes yamanashiensis]GIJ06595.1 DUF305 domain-containing protein [Spirilliplanes yamanashiensis]